MCSLADNISFTLSASDKTHPWKTDFSTNALVLPGQEVDNRSLNLSSSAVDTSKDKDTNTSNVGQSDTLTWLVQATKQKKRKKTAPYLSIFANMKDKSLAEATEKPAGLMMETLPTLQTLQGS